MEETLCFRASMCLLSCTAPPHAALGELTGCSVQLNQRRRRRETGQASLTEPVEREREMRQVKSGEASRLIAGCRGDSRVKNVLVSHCGNREDTSTRSLRDLLLCRHGSTATTSPRQPAMDDERPRLSGCQGQSDITDGVGPGSTAGREFLTLGGSALRRPQFV